MSEQNLQRLRMHQDNKTKGAMQNDCGWAADRIESLEAQLAEAKIENENVRLANIDAGHWVDAAKHDIDQLTAQLEECRKDAARYKWLRYNCGFGISEKLFGVQEMRVFKDADLDSMLDAALSQEKADD